MSLRKLHIQFLFIWLITVVLLVTFIFLVLNHALAWIWLLIPLLLLLVVAFDTFRNKRAIGACGFQTPDELTPDIFFKRTEQNLNQSFAEFYFEHSNAQVIVNES